VNRHSNRSGEPAFLFRTIPANERQFWPPARPEFPAFDFRSIPVDERQFGPGARPRLRR
jgi:hypothetical protein